MNNRWDNIKNQLLSYYTQWTAAIMDGIVPLKRAKPTSWKTYSNLKPLNGTLVSFCNCINSKQWIKCFVYKFKNRKRKMQKLFDQKESESLSGDAK